MTVRTWPDMLPPAPSVEAFQVAADPQAIYTQMETGPERARRRTFARIVRPDATWRMSGPEAEAFWAWFDDAPWSLAGASESLDGWTLTNATAGAGVAGPGGFFATARLAETAGTGIHRAQRSLGPAAAGGTVSLAATLRAAGRTTAVLALVDRGGVARTAQLDLTTGGVAVSSGVTAQVTDRGDGWWRVAMTADAGTGDAEAAIRIALRDGALASSYEGTEGAGVDVAEVQARMHHGFGPVLRCRADGTVLGGGGGTAWFRVPIAYAGRLRQVEARVFGAYTDRQLQGLHSQISAQMTVRGVADA